jgi:hypothetical protein
MAESPKITQITLTVVRSGVTWSVVEVEGHQ